MGGVVCGAALQKWGVAKGVGGDCGKWAGLWVPHFRVPQSPLWVPHLWVLQSHFWVPPMGPTLMGPTYGSHSPTYGSHLWVPQSHF